MSKVLYDNCPQCGQLYQSRRASGRRFALCESCRRGPCVVCGNPIPIDYGGAMTNTCSDAHQRQKIKSVQLNHYAKKMAQNPNHAKQGHAKQKQRRELDPQKKAAYLARERERNRLRAKDAEYQSKRAEYYAKYYEDNRERIVAARKAFWDGLTPSQRETREDSIRATQRRYKQRRYAEISADATLRAEHLQYQRSHRIKHQRKKALAQILKDAQKLTQRRDDDGDNHD